jgi:uncharacterized SAM-binding protein YcdF (DUF218 family)
VKDSGDFTPSERRRLTWKRAALVTVLLLAALLALAPLAFSAIGKWLMVDDPLQPARAVVVFGGQLPFRAMEAASIYKQGFTHEVWLTQGGVFPEDLAVARLGIDKPAEYFYNRQVLEHLGVPADSIRLLDGRNINTAEEVRTIARELKARGGDRVILITSKYHARRVKVLWRVLAGQSGEAIVRYTPDDPFRPDRWWRNTGDAMSVTRELFGLVNAWAGFPVKSERW